jgi:hypothetical protein
MIKQQQTLRRAREAGRSKIGSVKFSDRRSSHSHAVGIEQRARRPCLRDGRDVRLVLPVYDRQHYREHLHAAGSGFGTEAS